MALFILIARGSLNGHLSSTTDKKTLLSMVCFGIGFFSLFIIERVIRDIDHKYCYETGLGAFILILRVAVFGVFLYCCMEAVKQGILDRHSMYAKLFVGGASTWFLVVPFIVLFSALMSPFSRMLAVLSVCTAAQCVALIALHMLISRSGRASYVRVDNEDAGSGPYDDI
jgi:hypothetical protein